MTNGTTKRLGKPKGRDEKKFSLQDKWLIYEF